MKFASRGFNFWAGTERRLGLAEVLAVCFLLSDSRSVLSKTKQPPRYRKKSVTRGPGAAAAGAVTCTVLARGAGSVLAVSWALLGSKIPYRENGANPEGASGDAATEIASVRLGNSLASAGCVCAQPAGLSPSPQTLLASSCSVWTMGFLSPNESRGLKAPLFPPRGVCGGSVPPGSGQAAAARTFPAAGGFSPSRRAARRFGKLPCTCLLHFAASASQRRSSFSRDNVPLCAGLPAGRGRGGMPWGSAPLARGLPV